MLHKNYYILFFSILVSTNCGCTHYRDIYDWGGYDLSLEKVFNVENRQFLINDEIEIIANELAATRPERVPPGKTAHLGYLYAIKGDSKTAQELFKQEKILFPESTVFMDKLIKQLSTKNNNKL